MKKNNFVTLHLSIHACFLFALGIGLPLLPPRPDLNQGGVRAAPGPV